MPEPPIATPAATPAAPRAAPPPQPPARRATARVQAEDLNVDPALLALPLAHPGRRLVAMGIDLALIGLLSLVANLWLLGGLALLLVDALRHGRGDGAGQAPWRPGRVVSLAAAALVLPGLWLGVTAPRPALSGLSVETEDSETAVERAVEEALQAGGGRVSTAALLAGVAASAASSPPAISPRELALQAALKVMAQRVTALEAAQAAQAVQAAEAAPAVGLPSVLRRLKRWFEQLGVGWGGSVLYFTLLPAAWRGQTPGKWLLGLRVVELTGKPMTALRCLKRYGGYAAGLATGGLGLAQLLWDSNRQALQDKTAHTVVVDLRRGRRGGGPGEVQ
mgnify:CR=1 FL=1